MTTAPHTTSGTSAEPATGQDTGASAPCNRRTMMRGAAIAGGVVAAGIGLAACGSGAAGSSSDSSGSGSSGGGAGSVLAKTSDIPVGEGKIFSAQKVVVTQPTAGTFKAFSSTCTHLGCTVGTVSGGLIQCPCHGSEFSVVDGSVKNGPATRPLPAQQITVKNNEITLA